MDDSTLSINHSPPQPPPRSEPAPSPNIFPPPPPLQRISQANFPEPSYDTNLARINNAFQDKTIIHIPINFHKSPSLIILCDFPSRIPDFGIRSQVFALDDLSYFLNATLNDSTAEIIVTTQQFSILRNLLFSPFPLSRPFHWFTRVSNAAPDELKIIEIINSLPSQCFPKIYSLSYLSSFSVRLINQKKLPYDKKFDLFLLAINPTSNFTSLLLPQVSAFIHGLLIGESPELLAQASSHLGDHAIPYSTQNRLQSKLPKHLSCISYHFPCPPHSPLESIIDILNSITYLKSFHFSAIASAMHGLPATASICFINIQKIDSDPIVMLFDKMDIPYFRNFVFLIFQATPVQLEKALLSALDYDLIIPPSFISTSQKITFQFIDEQLLVQLSSATQNNLLPLQITRNIIGTLQDVFFTPSFLSFLKLRFLCQDSPQMLTVKNNEGDISDVLSFTSSTLLYDTLPQNNLPFTFDFDNLTFTLSHLEPIFVIKPKSLVPYPYETQQEHFQRFTADHYSLASRIPLLMPHPTKGGPSANSLILSVVISSLPYSTPKITYIAPPVSPSFYIFLSPFDQHWTDSLIDFFPHQIREFTVTPLHEITITFPFCIIIEPITTPFPIPSFNHHPLSISAFGWINVAAFTSTRVLFKISSQSHLNLLYAFLKEHSSTFAINTIVGHATNIEIDSPSQLPPQNIEPADITMATEEDSPLDPIPDYSSYLLLSYRLLSYFSWERTFDHPRQRLLEATAGGLHLAAPAIFPLLTAALNTFSPNFFDIATSVISLFTQLSLTLPQSLRLSMFPQSRTDTESQFLYHIHLPSFPIAHDSDSLSEAFKNIFTYTPEDTLFIWAQPTLLFSSPNMPHITLSLYLSLLGHNSTITDSAKRRTSQHARPVVLKLYALLIECNIVQDNPPSTRHLLIEAFQPEFSTVTVYDPEMGQHIIPLRDLQHLYVTGLIFKRSSQKQLICPQLLQRFTALALPKHISKDRSPFSIISLFDGSGSFTDVIAKALGAWPNAILAAENDAGTRSVVSKVKGWPIDGTLWTLDKNGAQAFYAQDVWSLVDHHCLLLRQFLSLLPEDSVIFLGAGSPCPDLTIIGRGQGLLGLAGDRSVLIHCVWAVVYYLSFTPFWKRLVILAENAGSMKDHMKQYIHQLFGIPLSCCHYINCNKWGSVSRARNFFTVSDTQVIPPTSPSPFDNGWSPPINVSTQQPIPLPPWLRPRHTTSRGSVVQTPLAYHPKHLLYDISYFGTFQNFINSCQQNAPLLYPRIPFTDFLPEFLWSDWQALVDWNADFNSELTQAILDTVSKLQDFYSNPYIYLPFRLPSLREKARDSELSDLIDATIAEADPPLRTLHNIIGNFFKPSAVLAALGGPDSIRNYVYGDSVPHQWAPSSPDSVESNFKALRIRVINDLISQPHLQKHVSERWFPKKFPKIDTADYWHSATHMPTPSVNISPPPTLPPPPTTSTISLVSPLPAHVLTFLQLHPILVTLSNAAIHHPYPLDILLSKKVPPLIMPFLPLLFTTDNFHQHHYLQAYFQGWELYQNTNALVVIYENSGTVTMHTYGSLSEYYRLYLLVFSATSENLYLSLLLQGTSPAPELAQLLLNNHIPRSFPPQLVPYATLLTSYPELHIFADLASTSLSDPTIYIPIGQHFTRFQLPNSFLAHWATTLFEPGADTPMWAPDTTPNFSGTYPFIQHTQFWLFIHNTYLQAHTLPPSPYVFLHFITPGQTSSTPSFYFCIHNHIPSPEHILTHICPHIFVFNTHRDTNMESYAVIVDRPSSLYADLDAAALEAKPITYP